MLGPAFSLHSKLLVYTLHRLSSPQGRGQCPIWAIQVWAAVKGMVFKPFSLGWDISDQRVWVQNRVSFSQETDQLFKDFSLDQGNRRLPLKNIKNSSRFCFGQTVLVTSVSSFWKTATLGQREEGFGQFILVLQSRKIQLNQLWYRLRDQGSQRHIPTQNFLK